VTVVDPTSVGVSPDLDAAARLEVLPRKHLPTPVGVSPATSWPPNGSFTLANTSPLRWGFLALT